MGRVTNRALHDLSVFLRKHPDMPIEDRLENYFSNGRQKRETYRQVINRKVIEALGDKFNIKWERCGNKAGPSLIKWEVAKESEELFSEEVEERAVAAFAEFILANPKMPTVTRLNTFNQTLLAIEHGYSKVIERFGGKYNLMWEVSDAGDNSGECGSKGEIVYIAPVNPYSATGSDDTENVVDACDTIRWCVDAKRNNEEMVDNVTHHTNEQLINGALAAFVLFLRDFAHLPPDARLSQFNEHKKTQECGYTHVITKEVIEAHGEDFNLFWKKGAPYYAQKKLIELQKAGMRALSDFLTVHPVLTPLERLRQFRQLKSEGLFIDSKLIEEHGKDYQLQWKTEHVPGGKGCSNLKLSFPGLIDPPTTDAHTVDATILSMPSDPCSFSTRKPALAASCRVDSKSSSLSLPREDKGDLNADASATKAPIASEPQQSARVTAGSHVRSYDTMNSIGQSQSQYPAPSTKRPKTLVTKIPTKAISILSDCLVLNNIEMIPKTINTDMGPSEMIPKTINTDMGPSEMIPQSMNTDMGPSEDNVRARTADDVCAVDARTITANYNSTDMPATVDNHTSRDRTLTENGKCEGTTVASGAVIADDADVVTLVRECDMHLLVTMLPSPVSVALFNFPELSLITELKLELGFRPSVILPETNATGTEDRHGFLCAELDCDPITVKDLRMVCLSTTFGDATHLDYRHVVVRLKLKRNTL